MCGGEMYLFFYQITQLQCALQYNKQRWNIFSLSREKNAHCYIKRRGIYSLATSTLYISKMCGIFFHSRIYTNIFCLSPLFFAREERIALCPIPACAFIRAECSSTTIYTQGMILNVQEESYAGRERGSRRDEMQGMERERVARRHCHVYTHVWI